MPIEIQGVASAAHPGDTVSFNFQNPVIAYTIGIWAFHLTYGPGVDDWVENLSIKILPNQVIKAGPVGYQVSAIIQMVLQDASGHTINTSESVLWPVCIAITGSIPQPGTVMSRSRMESPTAITRTSPFRIRNPAIPSPPASSAA